MKSIVVGLSLISSLALAETATITVEGMHCSGCKESVKAKVCGSDAVKANAESCDVKLTDEEKQIGEITIVTKPEKKVDMAAVEAGVKAAGEYKVGKVEVKEIVMKTADAGTPAEAKKDAKVKKIVKKVTESKKETK